MSTGFHVIPQHSPLQAGQHPHPPRSHWVPLPHHQQTGTSSLPPPPMAVTDMMMLSSTSSTLQHPYVPQQHATTSTSWNPINAISASPYSPTMSVGPSVCSSATLTPMKHDEAESQRRSLTASPLPAAQQESVTVAASPSTVVSTLPSPLLSDIPFSAEPSLSESNEFDLLEGSLSGEAAQPPSPQPNPAPVLRTYRHDPYRCCLAEEHREDVGATEHPTPITVPMVFTAYPPPPPQPSALTVVAAQNEPWSPIAAPPAYRPPSPPAPVPLPLGKIWCKVYEEYVRDHSVDVFNKFKKAKAAPHYRRRSPQPSSRQRVCLLASHGTGLVPEFAASFDVTVLRLKVGDQVVVPALPHVSPGRWIRSDPAAATEQRGARVILAIVKDILPGDVSHPNYRALLDLLPRILRRPTGQDTADAVVATALEHYVLHEFPTQSNPHAGGRSLADRRRALFHNSELKDAIEILGCEATLEQEMLTVFYREKDDEAPSRLEYNQQHQYVSRRVTMPFSAVEDVQLAEVSGRSHECFLWTQREITFSYTCLNLDLYKQVLLGAAKVVKHRLTSKPGGVYIQLVPVHK